MVLLMSALAAVSVPARAEAIYKYVDEKGNVTYSSVRLNGNGKGEKLDAPVTPDAEDVAAARRQLAIDKQLLQKYEDERRALEAAEAAYLQQAAQFAPQQTMAAGAGDDAVYYPVWGVGSAFRPIRPWPRPPKPVPPRVPARHGPSLSKPTGYR